MTLAETVTTIGVITSASGGVASLFYILPKMKKLQAQADQVKSIAGKTDMDAAQVLSDAALKQLDAAVKRAERADQRAEHAEKRADAFSDRLDKLERYIYQYARAAEEHAIWDFEVKNKLEELGVSVPDPPELVPMKLNIEREAHVD